MRQEVGLYLPTIAIVHEAIGGYHFVNIVPPGLEVTPSRSKAENVDYHGVKVLGRKLKRHLIDRM